MRALTIRQPHASLLMFSKLKPYETRTYQPRCVSVDKEIAIHAGVVIDPLDRDEDWPALAELLRLYNVTPVGKYPSSVEIERLVSRLPTGLILGLARFEGATKTEDLPRRIRNETCGDFSLGRFAWRLRPTLKLNPGIRARGRLGLWRVPPEIDRYLPEARR